MRRNLRSETVRNMELIPPIHYLHLHKTKFADILTSLLHLYSSIVRDVIAGTIMAATSVPQLVAYAQAVGYASWRGLATAGPSLLAWGFTTGSPFMSCGVTSITALMAKADLDGESYVAEHGEEAYVNLVAAYSLWVGLCSALLGVVGFGKLAGMVPGNVRQGFKVRLVLFKMYNKVIDVQIQNNH